MTQKNITMEELGTQMDIQCAVGELMGTINAVALCARDIPTEDNCGVVIVSGNKFINDTIASHSDEFMNDFKNNANTFESDIVADTDNVEKVRGGMIVTIKDSGNDMIYKVSIGSRFNHPAYSSVIAHRDI